MVKKERNPGLNEIEKMAELARLEIEKNNFAAAAQIYGQILVNAPENADLHHVYGLTLNEIGKVDQAIAEIETALHLNAENAHYYRSLGDIFFDKNEFEASTKAYGQSLRLKPDDTDTLINYGNLLNKTGKRAEAIAHYQKVLKQMPDHAKALCNIGKTAFDQGELDLSLYYYGEALKSDPVYAEAHFNRAVSLLMQNDFTNGWKAYEWRFERSNARRVYPHHIGGKRWRGEELASKKLLIHCEQGFGDVIQFSRLLHQLDPLGGRLLFEVQAPLMPLFEDWTMIEKLLVFDPEKPAQQAYDYYCPLLSLNYVMNFSPERLHNSALYIHPPVDRMHRWRHISDGPGIRVGIVWQGSETDPRRQCRLQEFVSLLAIDGVTFFSLQTGESVRQLQSLPKSLTIMDCGSQFRDFGDTAAVISQLDLVISIDTATAHLAGAMGKRVWIILPKVPDWRWGLNGDRTFWYPSALLFRQKIEESWTQPVSAVVEALEKMLQKNQAGKDTQSTGSVSKETIEEWFNQAVSLFQKGRLSDAATLFQKITQRSPDFKEAHFNLGLIFQQLGQLREAEARYQDAIELGMKTPQVFNNLGVLFEQEQKYDEALALFHKASTLDSGIGDSFYNAGTIQLRFKELIKAKSYFQRAIQCNPKHYKALCNLGRVFHLTGDLQQALGCYDKAIAIHPQYPEGHFNRGISLLLDGRWQEGWPEYEWRFQCYDAKRTYPHTLKGEKWHGESFVGKTLLIHSEQGIGDAIQLVRYLPLVKKRGGRLIFEARRSLMTLFDQLRGVVDELLVLSSTHPPNRSFDYFAPLSSLPGIFQTTSATVPQKMPYLEADPGKIPQWRNRMLPAKLHIGFVWSGNDTYKERACTLNQMAPLFDLPDIHWVSLQKGPAIEQLSRLTDSHKNNISDWGSAFDDFSDTAAAIHCLDLIISIDTAVAHLAGAMGKRVWILLPRIPDWRWLLNGDTSPWYPTARLFRQSHTDHWEDVIGDLHAKLAHLNLSE